MKGAAKKALTAGVAMFCACTIAMTSSERPTTTSAEPPAPTASAVQLSAQVSALAQPLDPASLLIGFAERVVIPPSAITPFPTPQFESTVAPTSAGSTIKNVYLAVEPWVRYGFEVGAYAVGWVPYVGWLSPQIMIFYNFGERITRSITFNIADWLDGHITFGQGLINVGVDTFWSAVQLGIDQWNFWLPPLPPLPPLPGSLFSTKQAPSTFVLSQPLSNLFNGDPVAATGATTSPDPQTPTGGADVAKGVKHPGTEALDAITKGPTVTAPIGTVHRNVGSDPTVDRKAGGDALGTLDGKAGVGPRGTPSTTTGTSVHQTTDSSPSSAIQNAHDGANRGGGAATKTGDGARPPGGSHHPDSKKNIGPTGR
jgi:hypothetical protein